MNRRSFLKMAGVASLAYAILPGEVPPRKPVRAHLPMIQQMFLGLTAALIDASGKRVSPHFVIPEDWWEFTSASARLKNTLTWEAHETITLGGFGLFEGERLIHFTPVTFNSPYAITGETVQIYNVAVEAV